MVPAQRPENATALLTHLSNTVTATANVSAAPRRTFRTLCTLCTLWLKLALPVVTALALIGWAVMPQQAEANGTQTVVVTSHARSAPSTH